MLGSDGDILLDVPNKKLVDLFSRCYSVLYSPVNEDFGIIPLEAMASGKPCIAVNEGGPKEVVLNNKTGFLVDSEADMARKMSLIASNPDKAERMGRAGRRLARSKYSWKAFMKRFRVRLREACKRS
jgi:alpha-1,3/alpha-1,6-mannosyltransferase